MIRLLALGDSTGVRDRERFGFGIWHGDVSLVSSFISWNFVVMVLRTRIGFASICDSSECESSSQMLKL